jgi:acetylornithine/N-succinyldiaminopimelate aminotransferase
MTNAEIAAQADQVIIRTYGRYPLAFVRGQGATVWDADGKAYTDFLSGIAVCVLGHCHPRVVEAIKKQAETLLHISNFYQPAEKIRLHHRGARQRLDAGGRIG